MIAMLEQICSTISSVQLSRTIITSYLHFPAALPLVQLFLTTFFSPLLPFQLNCKGFTKSTNLNPDNCLPMISFFSHVLTNLASLLSIIFNTIFERSELPPAWLTSTVLPLFKKGERNQASNYRLNL